MTKQYTVTLTEAEDKALGVVAISQQDWIDNLVRARCISAMDDIIASEVQRKLALGEPITGTKDDIVLAAEIETAVQRQARLEEEFKKLQEQQG